jgi:hypothetical protein
VIAGGSGFEEVTAVVTEIDVDRAQLKLGLAKQGMAKQGVAKQMHAQLRWLAGPLRLP